jgi:4-aminobutyrate aminotransferase-like enzyme
MTDVDGRRYLDFHGGYFAVNFGPTSVLRRRHSSTG